MKRHSDILVVERADYEEWKESMKNGKRGKHMGALISREILSNYLKSISNDQKLKIHLVNQCAPVIKRLKPATMLMIENQCLKNFCILAQEWQLERFLLYGGVKKSSVLLFHSDALNAYLNQFEVRQFLAKMGYEQVLLENQLKKLGQRIEQYYELNQEYPHELGIFLGYPIGDVLGFLTQKGEQVLYRGYWNVYCDVEEAKSTFASFDRAREELLWMLIKE